MSHTEECGSLEGLVVQGQVSSYQIVKLLGKGGQVCAWLGVDTASGQYVVVRVPKPGLDPALLELNSERLRIAYDILYMMYNALRLTAPHLTLRYERVRDYTFMVVSDSYGTPHNAFVLITEYISGVSLMDSDVAAACMSAGVRSPTCRGFISQLLEAVYVMHGLGVIHRDIKPSNIIAAPWGPVLIDFTTAKYFYIKQADISIFSPGGYTAPEQLQNVVSTQSDVWSVGATLLTLFTGQEPLRFMKGYPKSPRLSLPALREALKPRRLSPLRDLPLDLIVASLDPDPARRPATYGEAVRLMDGGSVEAEGEAELVALGRRFVLEERGTYCIGTSEECEIRIGRDLDPEHVVSGFHAMLYWDDSRKRWVLQDLCSQNGTAVWRPGVDQGWHVLWWGRRYAGSGACTRGQPAGSPAVLGDTALIALGIDQVLGTYLVLVFREGGVTIPSYGHVEKV